jgi:Protein of unknown function (DUF3105)
VSSRQEQKEARRRERMERERKEAAAAARRRRLQLVGGTLLGAAAIAGIVVAIAIGIGGGDDSTPSGEATNVDEEVLARLPEQQTTDLNEAAKAAGCKVTTAEFEGASHEEKDFTAADYKTNPPTSGTHTPDWYDDGVYEPGTTGSLGMLVHTLEHGRINIQYKKGSPAQTVEELEALYNQMNEGYHLLLYENTTGMDAAVAATAWTNSLTCPEMNDKVFDAIRTFRQRYIDRGPETVP